jgi:hypothetical protein
MTDEVAEKLTQAVEFVGKLGHRSLLITLQSTHDLGHLKSKPWLHQPSLQSQQGQHQQPPFEHDHHEGEFRVDDYQDQDHDGNSLAMT